LSNEDDEGEMKPTNKNFDDSTTRTEMRTTTRRTTTPRDEVVFWDSGKIVEF